MAIIKFCNRKCNTQAGLKNLINYVLNPTKTESNFCLGNGVGTQSAKTYNDMILTKKAFNKLDKRQAVHFVLSFDDVKDKDIAYIVGSKVAEYYSKDYQVLMALHTDTNNLHLHFIINTININTGLKFRQNKQELEQFKEYVNNICKEHKIKPIEKNNAAITEGEYHSNKRGKYAWKDIVYSDINMVLKTSKSKAEFISKMDNLGYMIKWTDERKNITFTTPQGNKVRDVKLGFDKAYFENKFEQNKTTLPKQQSFINILRNFNSQTPDFMDFPSGIDIPNLDGLNEEELALALSKYYTDLESERAKILRTNEEEQEKQQKSHQLNYLMDIIENIVNDLKTATLPYDLDDEDEWEL